MKTTLLTAAAGLAASTHAANIYVLSGGDPATDTAAIAALIAGGHTATLGVEYTAFDGTQSLAGFQTVYLQANGNWFAGVMPVTGQQALVDWVQAGGRLVTCEWVVYYTYPLGSFGTLGSIIPTSQSYLYGSSLITTYDQATPDPAINAGVPASLQFALTSYTGTEVFSTAKAGATTYYTSQASAGATGLNGWAQGAGSVFSFSTTCGPDQLADPNFARLFSNVMGAGGSVCYPDCDSSTTAPILNVADFSCFLNAFAAGQSYANCDHSTIPPVLNVADFSCFLNAFATGCT